MFIPYNGIGRLLYHLVAIQNVNRSVSNAATGVSNLSVYQRLSRTGLSIEMKKILHVGYMYVGLIIQKEVLLGR